MSPDLDALLRQLEPASTANRRVRLMFGLACVERVDTFLELAEVREALARFRLELARAPDAPELEALAGSIEALASRHPGSRSLDGVGHAAVSATYACAMAIKGRARQAAEYAAYAAVYGQGGYGATTEPSSFGPEYAWQAERLRALLAAASALPESDS